MRQIFDEHKRLQGNGFTVLGIGVALADGLSIGREEISPELAERYLGAAEAAVYLIRPDQHVAGRWPGYDPGVIAEATARAMELRHG